MRRGRPGSHPSGIGYITAKGYHRAFFDGRPRFLHNVVWEEAHGPIPKGHEVHHINEDKADNRLENLMLVTSSDHRRIHSEKFRRNDGGEWERSCNICGEWKVATAENFYLSKEGWILYGRCRPCHIARVTAKRKA